MKYDYGALGERYRQGNPKYSVCKKGLSATLSTKDILLLTDSLAASKFTATIPVLNWKESLDEINKEYGVMVVKFVTSKSHQKRDVHISIIYIPGPLLMVKS
jgi:hypothetical protein